jgi:hypothetical protein
VKHALALWLALLALGLVGACASAEQTTAIDLRISAELAVPGELDRLTVSVSGQDTETDPSADLREKALPRSIRLVHEGGPLGPVRLSVRGWLGAALVVEHDAVTAFREGELVALDVLLTRACANVICPTGSTCSEGACEPIEADAGAPDGGGLDAGGLDAAAPNDGASDAADGAVSDAAEPSLDGASGDAASEGPDASPYDAGLGAGERDAAVDAGAPDAGSDAGFDASAPEAGAGDAGADAGGASDAAVVDAGPGAAPRCTVLVPALGDSYQLLASFAAQGSCSDPETGALASGITWTSDRDGRVGTGAATTLTLRSLGAHTLSLCAADPRNASVVGCASVALTVTLTAQPTITISALTQNGAVTQPFSAGPALSASATVSGAGVSVAWSDDLDGPLGSGLTLAVPTAHVGRHTLSAVATDRQNASRSATRSYLVVLPGETNLVSPYGALNTALARLGDPLVTALAGDSSQRVYFPSQAGGLYRADATSLAGTATRALGAPPLRALASDTFIDEQHGLGYVATVDGYYSCSFSAGAGVAAPCSEFRGGALPSNNVLGVLRMSESGGAESLVIGTGDGLLIADDLRGSARGTQLLRGRRIADMASFAGRVALATDRGLWLLTPSTRDTTRVAGDLIQTAQLSGVAAGSDGSLWAGGASGLYHYVPSTGAVTSYTALSGLGAVQVRGVAVERVTLGSSTRDFVWLATSGGLVRLDTANDGFARFTTADGLPSNDVRAVLVTSGGLKVLGTARGLGRYAGY